MALLAAEGQKPRQIQRALEREGFFNPSTGSPYSLSTVKTDLSQRGLISELIGRVQTTEVNLWRSLSTQATMDAYRTDYQYWDELSSCKLPDYDIAGLFCNPIAKKIAFYSLGTDPIYKLAEDEEVDDRTRYYTDQKLKSWTKGHLSQLQKMLVDRNRLGDQFVIVNPNGSISVPSPDTVEVFRSVEDPREIVQIMVRNRYQTSSFETGIRRPVTVYTEDIYNASVVVRNIKIGNNALPLQVYDNIFGRIPLVHFPNNQRSNELYGRPEYEELRPILAEFNDTFKRGGQGVKLMGNPIMAFEGLDNIQTTIDAMKSSLDTQWEDDELTAQSRDTVDVTAGTALFVPKGTVNFKHPGIGFTKDWREFLDLCFILICNSSHIPEYMWGAAVEASKASTETQESPFITYIEGKRVELDGVTEMDGTSVIQGMLDLMNLILIALRFTDPKIHVGRVKSRYQELAREDDQIRLQKTIYADSRAYAPPAEVMTLLNLSDDPEKSVVEGQKELQKRTALESGQDNFMSQLNAAAHKEVDPTKNESAPQSAGGGKQVSQQ